MSFKTIGRFVQGQERAARVAGDLVRLGVTFQFEPMVGDFYGFWVWPEDVERLESLSLQFREYPSMYSPTRRQAMEAV